MSQGMTLRVQGRGGKGQLIIVVSLIKRRCRASTPPQPPLSGTMCMTSASRLARGGALVPPVLQASLSGAALPCQR